MEIKKINTQFAPAERANPETVDDDAFFLQNNELLNKIADAVSTMLVVLNPQRQIVFANKLFVEFLNQTDSSGLIGKRPGEAVSCIHAFETEGGCGTTEFCGKCGAANAILESQKGKQSEKECRIFTNSNDALDLRVTASPFYLGGKEYTFFAIHDISNEKRRKILERVFFHDVLNSAGGISGLSEILTEVQDPEEIQLISKTINRATENMINEIQAQRQLSAAENGDLAPDIKKVWSLGMLKDVTALYSGHELVKNKNILIDKTAENLSISTDPVILRRILGNMLKNALEASVPQSTVTLSCREQENYVCFYVHNPSYMEREIQLQLFNRSFSTKGTGRGIGTYSMKLLGEKYLKGRVGFESSRENGTTFFIKIAKNEMPGQ